MIRENQSELGIKCANAHETRARGQNIVIWNAISCSLFIRIEKLLASKRVE